MSKALSIQLKSVFLLVIFNINIFAGFACAVGVDMGFNTNHHHEKDATEIHVHGDGKKHHHEKPAHNHENRNKKDKDNCCNDSVIKLSQVDKSVPQPKIVLNPMFINAFAIIYYYIDIFHSSQVGGNDKYFARNYHPPIPDIRIAIQSFQI
jgi:hypothetical protein